MYKNTGQPGFDLTLKRPGKGHRLCNPFRTTCFFTRTHLTRTHMGRTQTRLTRPVCQVYLDPTAAASNMWALFAQLGQERSIELGLDVGLI